MLFPQQLSAGEIDLANPLNWGHPLNRGLAYRSIALPQFRGENWPNLARHSSAIEQGTLVNMDPTTDWVGTTRQGGWGALDFDAVDDRVDIPAMRYGSRFSIGGWAKAPNLAATRMLIAKKTTSGSTNNSVQVFVDTTGAITARVFDAGAFIGRTTSIVVTAGEWFRWLATYDGGTTSASVKVYAQGRQRDTTDSASGAFSSFDDLLITTTIGAQNIGDAGGYALWLGQQDDVLIYRNRVLSASEVAGDYDLSRRHYPGVLNRITRFPAPFVFDYAEPGTGGFPRSRIVGGA